ncbi:ATP-binding protein [Streptomyces mangrovisoli]|uniref:ATP-binding protein n=1 Tax=Streptomyces mangrovisoli TaxID=1428628 RepID=UPI000ADDD8F9|nr:ATP-binding protein [Streptomyces mangrovisoli]
MIELPDLAAGAVASVATVSALALGGGLLRSRRRRAALSAENDTLRARLDAFQQVLIAEVEHLAAQRLPATAKQPLHPSVPVPGALQPQLDGTPLAAALDHVLTAARAELDAQRTRIDAAAQAGMRGATREIQAALYRLQDALRGLQQRYDEPELSQTLFALDHENEQSLRRAQVAAVVCGAWVGLAREESHLVDAVTGGQARLAGYHRVTVHNHLEPGTALVSHAVEPVAIIVAELLDNALRHSAPDTDVVVNLEHVHHGVCVTIDDAGLGMTQDERERAQRLVAGHAPIMLTDLGDPPRMGLAAIGQLTRQFDLTVDVSSPSPYGGVRAVLRAGSHLLTRVDPEQRPPAVSAPRSTRRPGATASATPAPAHDPASAAPASAAHGYSADAAAATAGHRGDDPADTGGLPQRRRRTRAQEPPAAVPRQTERRPEEAAAALGALQSGTAAARSAPPSDLDDTVPARPAAAPTAHLAPEHPTAPPASGPAAAPPAAGPAPAHPAAVPAHDTVARPAPDMRAVAPTDDTEHEGGPAR